MTNTSKRQDFNKVIFAFYKKHGRAMPWRDTSNPYRIMVSEVMLQQTQVSRVLEKYPQFLKRFPTQNTLANSSLGDVLRAWSGLGYNRRAKHLWMAARQIMEEREGKFPQTMENLMELSGIGRSTAAGIMAFAFGEGEPMIDTNIRRVLARVFFNNEPPSDVKLYGFAKKLIPKGKGRMWNYAMLDVAALKCTARNHALDCPLQNLHGSNSDIKDFIKKYPQKKFLDSNRFYRGRILELLRKKSLTKNKLTKEFKIPKIRIEKIVQRLIVDGLVVQEKSTLTLP